MRNFITLLGFVALICSIFLPQMALSQGTEQGNELVILTENEARLLELNTPGDMQILSVRLEANIRYIISAEAQSESGDPEIFLRDSENFLDYNDDQINLNSQIVFTPLESGVYKIFVRHNGTSYGPVETELIKIAERQIISLALGENVSGTLAFSEDVFIYQIHLEAGETYSATSVGSEELDAYIEVYTPEGTLIDSNDDNPLGPTYNALVFFHADSSGLHRVEVSSSYAGTTGDFETAVNNIKTSRLKLNKTLYSSISQDSLHPLTINLVEGQTYTVDLRGATSIPQREEMIGDSFIELLHIEDSDAYLRFDDSSGGNLDPFETFVAPLSGVYSVVVSDIQESGDNYRLTIFEGDVEKAIDL